MRRFGRWYGGSAVLVTHKILAGLGCLSKHRAGPSGEGESSTLGRLAECVHFAGCHAKSQDVEVSFLTLATRGRPGVIGYVLPGLGRADRLWNEGRKIAMRWLAGAHAGVDAAQRV